MKCLRHLYLPMYLKVDDSKVQLGKLSNLETLKNFDGEHWEVQDLAQLTKLRKLQIRNAKSFKELVIISSNPPVPFQTTLSPCIWIK